MNIFNENGFLDIPALIKTNAQMFVIIGARRIGKTYGVLEYYAADTLNGGDPIVYARLRDTQIQLAATDINNPWLPICRNHDFDITFEKVGRQYLAREVIARADDGKPAEYGRIIAQARSIYDSRGIASGGYQAIVVDEFIPERGAIERKFAGYNLKSTIQTLSDNRTDLKIWLLANANNLDNDILSEFGLIPEFESMTRKHEQTRLIADGAILLVNVYNSPISTQMAQTKMGKILNTGEYGAMAYSNEFATANFVNIANVNLREYSPLVRLDTLLVYKHKNNRQYHITQHIGNTKLKTVVQNARCYSTISAKYPALIVHIDDGQITYDSFDTKRKFYKLVKEQIT